MKTPLVIYSIQESRFFLRGEGGEFPRGIVRFEADESLTWGFSGDAMRAPLTTIGRRRRATILVMSGAVFPAECAVYHSVADTIIQWRNPGEDYSRIDEESAQDMRRALRTRRIMSLLARTSAWC
ncbi:Uncharacterized protein DBV15_11351 [Temnothorax longispinosus]|uniref:Uncharacterized protein n=1 Tax=Temnothorax longispinosus TaxID=300112 RepID=A0A4S2JR10_9HYME|nr:Uncharacterized protein DBV15_11351 [Temnothorax longispinosus]